MIAEGDFPGDFGDGFGDRLKLGLRALANHIKRFAHFDLDGFIFWRVINPIFANKLEAALGIGCVDADGSFGQRHAEVVVCGVCHFQDNTDFL